MIKKFNSVVTIFLLAVLQTACTTESESAKETVAVADSAAKISVSSKSASPDSITQNSLASGPEITVYKSPTCGCCAGWVTYLEEEGFKVTAIDHDDVNSLKSKLGLPDPALGSCHTAVVDEYVIEGHVPASDIKRLLTERPGAVKGLTAPGMPMMSPGMASREPKDYDVLSFTETGETAVFSSY